MIETGDNAGTENTGKLEKVAPTADQQRIEAQLDVSAAGEEPVVVDQGDADADSVMVMPPAPELGPIAVEKQSAPVVTPESKEPKVAVVKPKALPAQSKPATVAKADAQPNPEASKATKARRVEPEKVVTALAVTAPEVVAKDEDKEKTLPYQEQPVVKRPSEKTEEEPAKPPAPQASAHDGGSGVPPVETAKNDAFDDGDKDKATLENRAPKEAAKDSKVSDKASSETEELRDDSPSEHYLQALSDFYHPSEDDTRTPEEREAVFTERQVEFQAHLRAKFPRETWNSEHPTKDELNDGMMAMDADFVRYTAPEPVVAAVRELADTMEEVPFRSPAYLTCMYELADRLVPEAAAYETIVINDHTGRLPGFVMVKLINEARAKAKLEPVNVYFANGKNNHLWQTPEARNFTAEGRTLILMSSLKDNDPINIYDAIRENNIAAKIDFAAVGGVSEDIMRVDYRAGVESRVIIGNRSMGATELYADTATLNRGVMEQDGTAVLARQPNRVFDGMTVAKARQEAAKVAAAFQKIMENPPVADMISSDDDVAKTGLFRDIARRFRGRE
jgi:hypothetical protein